MIPNNAIAKMTTNQSLALNGCCVYQVRFFFEPKRTSKISTMPVIESAVTTGGNLTIVAGAILGPISEKSSWPLAKRAPL